MSSSTIEIRPATHALLQRMAQELGETVTELLEQAVNEYRRKKFLEGLNEDFQALRADPMKWTEELNERSEWDATLADGLEDEPT